MEADLLTSRPALLIKKYERDFYQKVEKYIQDQGYTQIGIGGYRKAFVDRMKSPRSVVKIPREQCGFEHNIREAYVYRKYRNGPDDVGVVYAPCRLLPNGCLLMSYITPVPHGELPAWASYIDCYQVGKFKDRFVAYDGGCDIPDIDKPSSLRWAGAEAI